MRLLDIKLASERDAWAGQIFSAAGWLPSERLGVPAATRQLCFPNRSSVAWQPSGGLSRSVSLRVVAR